MKNLLLTITIVLVAITSSWTQTTYYVNDNSTVGDILTTAVGNNANPGTAAAPFLTIAYAVSQAINGDIIIVDVGTYAETVTINIDVTIRGANFGVDPNTGTRVAESIVEDGGFQIPGANTVIIDGFQVFQTNTTTPVSLGGAAAATIQNCILERQGVAPGSPIRGIETSAGAGIKTIANNLFTGDVSGGLFGGHLTWNSGMYVNGAGSTIAITDNVFENCRTAINLDDFNANITISSNTFDNNGTHLSFGGASATSGSFTLGANEFKVPGSAIINLSNVTAAFRLDITAGTFNGTAFSALSLADLFNIEAGMYHRGRSSRNGLVYYVANNLYVRSDINANIQTAIDYAAANDVVNIQDGTYNQRLTVTKSLTLDGQSKAGTILDGTGLSGTGSGVALSNNVTDFTIKDLTVQNYAGSTPNTSGGIYAPSNNNNLTVDNVTIQNNTSAAGFYANGPIDNVSITNSMVNNHGPGARGIVIWNGLKTNITITDNMVSNNNCCGIELQDGDASAVNISDNTIDIGGGDNAIGIVGLNPSVGSNTINNNTITGGGRYGIEIKNPAGDVTVDGNNVSLNTQNADLRDRGGIIIMRRGVLGSNVDVPNGVTITGNTVVGYVQSNGGSSSEGFGIVVEGTNHTVTGNTVQNCDVGIIQQQNPSGYPGDADQSDVSDLFFGRGNSPITCGNTISGNSFMGNGLDERNVGLSGGLVENTNTGEFFCSIQAAIDDPETLDGHAITVGTGTYIEDVNVNKANLTISGADAATTIVSGPAGGDGGTFRVAASGVTIEGFTITREGNNTTDWNDPNLNFAGVAIQGQTNNATIRENIITGNRTGIDINNSNGNQIIDNNIDFNRTGLLFRNQTDNTVMTGNFITDNWTMGVLFLDASGGTNSPVQSAINSQFNNNNISGNWYGDIVERQEGGSLPTPGTTNLKNFECNWFGTSSPVVSTANSTEPGYATHIPVAYGGMATNPGGAPNILGPASANFEFIPWGTDGADSDPAASGWQITPGTCTGCPLSVTIDANPSGDLCLSTTVQYSVTVTGGTADPITYAWCAYNSGDGSGTCFNGFNDNTLPDPTRTWSASPGAKSVGVTITQGACVAEDLYVFNINSLPNTSVSQDLTEICPGGAVELTFTDNDVTGNSFDITADLVDDNGTTTGGFSASGVPSGAQVTYTEGTDFVAAPGNTASLTNILVTNTTTGCEQSLTDLTITVNPVPVLTFEVNGSAADANTDPDVQVCDEENVTVTSLVLGAEDDETVFNVNFDYTNIDPASFAPAGDNTLTGTALRAAFEDVAIPMSLTDDTDEGSLIVTVTPYYDVDGDGQIDMTDDCPGDPVTVTINVDPVPVLTFEVNGSAADANTDPDVQVCDEENVTVTSLVLGAEDDETVFNVNFDYTNIDPASFAPAGDNTLTGTALRAAFEDVAIPMSLTDDTDEGSLIVTVTPYYDVDGDGQIDMTDDCPGDPVTVTINVDPVPVLTFEVNGSAADANTDPDVQVCDEENVTVTSLVLGAEDDETVFNVNFDYTNIDPASFAPAGDNTLTGTALRAAFEDVAIPMSLTDDTDEGSLIVTVTPYYDVDGDGQIDMTDDCPGDPVTVTINVDPVPVLTFEVNGSAADANTDPDVQVCDEENVTVTSLVLGAEDDETVFNVNFDYTNIDPASFAPAGDNTLTGTALRAAFEDVAIPMSLTDDTDEGSLVVTVTPYYDVDGDGQIDMTDDCPGDPVTVTINVDPVPVLTFEVNGSAADANTDPDVQVCDEENVTVTSLVLGAEDDETVFNVNFDYTNIDPASFAPPGDNTLTGTALRAAFEDVAIPMSLTDDTDEGSLIVTVTPYYDVDGDGQIDMTDDCPGDPVTVTINVDPVPVLTFEVNGSAADANTDPDVQVCDEENVTVTSLVLGAEDDETVFNVNFDYTNIDPASFAPPGDNTLTGTALRAAFEDVAIPMSLTDDTDEGSLIVTVTPYYDVDGDGQIDMTDDCPGDPVTVTINVDPVPVLTFEVNGSAADANTDPDVQVCDEENVTVTSLVLGAEDDETVFNVNFDYTNIDPASFAPPGDNTLTGTALRAAFEDVAIPMSLTDDTDEGSLIVTVTPYYDVDGDGQIDMTDDCPGDPVTVTINVDPVPVLTFEVNGSAADANTDPDVQVCDEENVTVTSLVLGAEDDETVFNVNFDYTNIDPASFAPAGDNTLTGTALRAAFEDVAIPMSLTDDTDEGSLVVTVTPYYDVDGDGQIDMTDDCPGDPVTVTINVDPVPVLTFEVNGSAADANTDPDVQVCDEENVTVTSLVLGAEDDETVFNVNFDYTNIDPASFAPAGDNTLTGTALRAAFEDVAIPMSLTDDTDEGSLIVTVTPYYDVDGDGQIDMTDDCPGDPVTVTINVDPVPVLTFEVNGSAAMQTPIRMSRYVTRKM
jgi:parallel beta-helix repeat protein